MRCSRIIWTEIVCLVISFCRVSQSSSLGWLSLARIGSQATVEQESLCDNVTGLASRQVRVCKRNLEMMDSVRRGARLAIDECQFQFRHHRWNCSSVHIIRLAGTRESAFVHAISAAGVAHAVTKACSAGESDKCGCDTSMKGKGEDGHGLFLWSGCSDNIAFGSAFSKNFLDSKERIKKRGMKSSEALMNIHNNQIGRKAIEYNMATECKCHGVSGSCEIRTCWKAMPNFRKVGDILREKFDGASEVIQRRERSRKFKDARGIVQRRGSSALVAVHAKFKYQEETDLVYLNGSPSFCDANPAIGSLGTQGRRCNKTSRGVDGCDIMCCQRGYKTRTLSKKERCKCKFEWCCRVNCQNCDKSEEVHTCL